MSDSQSSPPAAACPPTVDELQRQIRQRLDEIIAFCLNDQGPASFLAFEAALLGLLRSLGCLLIQLFLRARHDRLDPAVWQARGYRMADPAAERTLKTSCGPVAYIRAFLVPRHGGGPGVHPLDVALGLTARRLQPAGHRLVLPVGHPGELPGRQRARGDVPGGGAAGLGDRGVGPGPGPARLCVPQRRPLARERRRRAGHRDRRQGGPHRHGAGNGAASRPRAHHQPGCKCQRHRGRAQRSGGGGRSGGRRGTRARTAAAPRWW